MLEARKIAVQFGTRHALRNVSLAARRGDTIALIGPNGAGKTTLLRSLNATVRLTHGDVLLDSKPIVSLSRREIARNIAVVAQENETRFPITVVEFVLAGRFPRGAVFGWETEEDVRAAKHALTSCDLDGFSDRLMNELSGGERQRVVLARALAAETPVLLLDEPTANLDLAHQALMFRLVRERCRDGATAVIITHDMNLASEFADQTALLKNGEVIATGRPDEVLTTANIREAFDVEVLLDANPSSGRLRVTTVF